MDDNTTRLDRLLSRVQLLDPPYRESEEGRRVFQEICKLVFEEQLYASLWCEPTLNQLAYLFETEKPDEELFGAELEELRKRTLEVQEVNNFFFGILDPTTTVHELCLLLSKVHRVTEEFCNQLESSGRLQEIRNQEGSSSEKIGWFLEFMNDDIDIDLTERESVKGALASLKGREVVGKANALLVKGDEKAILVPLHIKIQSGTGELSCQVRGSEGFKDAVARAQSAMRERGYLSHSDDVFYTLDLTDIQYQGSSLSLAAAVAMYDAKQNVASDPYTAFTGEINLVGQDWTIKAVNGVDQKVAAAERAGCKRVFIPHVNCADIAGAYDIKVNGVESLIDTFVQLRPSHQLLPGDSLQGRKVGAVQQYCKDQGWDFPAYGRIQAGIQLQIVPLEVAPLNIQIYNSGTHTPKTSPRQEYDELVSRLNAIDQPAIPIRSINQSFIRCHSPRRVRDL